MMKTFISLLVFGGVLLWTAAPAGAQAASTRAYDRSVAPPAGSATAAGATLPSTVTNTDQPRQYFLSARDAFHNGDYNACAQDLRQAADLLRNDAAYAHGGVADNLRDSATGLDKLAGRIQRGEVRSIDEFNDKVGFSYKSLANFHYQIAKESYQRNRAANLPPGRDVETGNALNAAANDMQYYSEVTGRPLHSGTQSAINDIRDLAGKMVSGTGWAVEKAGTGLSDFGNAIREFGHDVGHSVLHPIRALEGHESTVPPPAPVPPTSAPQY